MKAAAKTLKPKRQEEQANFISWRFALLCGCILLALGFLLGRVAWLQIIALTCWCVRAICVLCACRKSRPRAG
jgi:hypothetical protein